MKNNNSNQGEEKNDLVNSTKSRSKVSKSDETNNLTNNANNKDNRNSPRNENQNAEGYLPSANYYENKAGSEHNSALNNNNNNHYKDNVSNLSINKIVQQNDNNPSSNVNNHGNLNTHSSNKEGSNKNIVNNSNYNSNNNHKNNAQGSHVANAAPGAGKKEDASIVDITSASRVITDEDVKNAPLLTIEVFFFDKDNRKLFNHFFLF